MRRWHFIPALTLLFSILLTANGVPREITAVVWIFTAVDCPVANGYAPELNRLRNDYEGLCIEFTLVYTEPSLSQSAIGAHLKDYSLYFSYNHDGDHTFVKKAGVTTTPEVAVFDADDQLVYRGKIDNRYSEFGDRRNTATETYLRDVLERVLSGEDIDFHETEPIGCFIEPLP